MGPGRRATDQSPTRHHRRLHHNSLSLARAGRFDCEALRDFGGHSGVSIPVIRTQEQVHELTVDVFW